MSQRSKRDQDRRRGDNFPLVVEKGKRVHTIFAVVSQKVDQTIVGWKDLMASGVISSDWPAMPRQETDGKIHAADDDEEEKELGKLKIHMLKK
jgi:hypothetical protein